MTAILDRPVARPALSAVPAAPRAPFRAPGPRPDASARGVTVTLTIELPIGSSEVESARLADALRHQARLLTAGRRARASVDIASPHPFTVASSRPSARTSTAPSALRPSTIGAAPATPARRIGVVSPDSAARRDVELVRPRTLQATAVSPSSAPVPGAALVIDLHGRRVRLDGNDVELTHKEFELLAHLASNARRIVSREELMETVWAGAAAGTGIRTVDVHVRRVRTKLGRYRRLVSTVRGTGYRVDPGSDVAIIG